MEKKKSSFFKRLKTSIFDFDGYQGLATEKVGRTIGYIAILMLIFSIIVSAIYTFQIFGLINKSRTYIDTQISEIKYENNNLNVVPKGEENVIKLDINNLISAKVIINTQTEDESKIQESINEIKNSDNGILLLKDRVIVKDALSGNTNEIDYKTICEKFNIDLSSISKDSILNALSGQDINISLAMFFVKAIIYMFILYFSTVLIDIILLVVLTYIVTRIAGLRLKYTAIYNIAAYSLTLPIILNILYFIINSFTGFTIKYFQVMYTAIASIYIITAILMIKSDVIKKQLELNRIIEEQERVKQELKQKEEKEKEEQEQERRRNEREKEREKEKQKEKRKNKDNNDNEGINKEPEGDNA